MRNRKKKSCESGVTQAMIFVILWVEQLLEYLSEKLLHYSIYVIVIKAKEGTPLSG